MRRRASVLAPADGLVRIVSTAPVLGETVIVDHGIGVVTLFAHLDIALVAPGDTVKRGTVLGWAGSSGLSEGVSLHYGAFVHGVAVDPRSLRRQPRWMKNRSRPEAEAVSHYKAPHRQEDPPKVAAATPAPTPTPRGGSDRTTRPEGTPRYDDLPPLIEPEPTPPPNPLPDMLYEPIRASEVRGPLDPEASHKALLSRALAERLRQMFAIRRGITPPRISLGPGRLHQRSRDIEVEFPGSSLQPFRSAVEAAILFVGQVAPSSLGGARITLTHVPTGTRVPLQIEDAKAFYQSGQSPPSRRFAKP